MNLKKQLFLLVLIGFFLQSKGQISTFHPKTKWKSLEYNSFRVILPSNLTNEGKTILGHLNEFQQNDSLIGRYNESRTFIVYGNHMVSNGFVGPGPYRSGLYLTPPQFNFIGPGDWTYNLVNHENHHFIQHAMARRGILKFMYKVFGDFTDSGLSNAFLLNWFWEGNAVQRESKNNAFGRGNYSHFLNTNRVFAKKTTKFDGKKFTYAYNRPMNKFIPNHYNLGYEMVNHLSHSYGDDFLLDRLNSSLRYLSPLPSEIKYKTRKKLFEHYENALDSIVEFDSKKSYFKPELVLKKTDKYINQNSVLIENTAEPIYIYSNFLEAAKVKQNGKTLFVLGQSPDSRFRIQGNKDFLVWNGLTTHPLYSGVTYSDIYLWNKKTKKSIKHSKKQKYFSPTIHPTKNTLAYIELDSLGLMNITTEDINTAKKEQFKIKAKYLRNVLFSENGESISFINQKQNEQIITTIHLETKKVQKLRFNNIIQISEAIISKNNQIYFAGDYELYEYIFKYDMESQQLWKSQKVGSSLKNLAIKNNDLYFDFLTENGNRLGKLNTAEIEFEVFEYKSNTIVNQKEVKQLNGITETKYKDALPRLKFHSVLPLLSLDNVQINVYGNDFLRKNTFAYTFYKNFRDDNAIHFLNYTYSHFPVHLSTGVEVSGSGNRYITTDDGIYSGFDQVKIPLKLSFPILRVEKSTVFQNTLSSSFNHIKINHNGIEKALGSTLNAIEIENNLNIAKIRGSHALSSPLYLQSNSIFSRDENNGYLFEEQLKFGVNIAKHAHFLEMEFGYTNESTDINTYRFRKKYVRPSLGYFLTTSSIGNSQQALGLLVSPESFHYKINTLHTLVYPNTRITDYLFVKRVSFSPFFESSQYKNSTIGNQNLNALGARFGFDLQVVKSLPVRLELTYAYGQNLKSNPNYFGFGIIL